MQLGKLPKMSASLFITDPIRPHPPWPLICAQENRPAHDTAEAAKAWLVKIAMDSNLYRLWECSFCGKWHHECTPSEASGSSNGKNFRKLQFMERRNDYAD